MAKKRAPFELIKLQLQHPMYDFTRETQERMEKFRSPVSEIARKMQERLDAIVPPSIIINRVNWESFQFKPKIITETYPLHNILGRELMNILNFSSTKTASQPILDLLNGYDLSTHDFQFENEEDLEVETFELDAIELSQPEKKIILLHEVNRLQTTIEDIYRDHNQLHKVKPRRFEEIIAELLRHQQFEVELTKQTRDGGYDLIAIKNLGDIPLRFLVECKRYAAHKPIGVNIVREFSNVVHTNNANKGLLLTTSYFSEDAKELRDSHMPYLLDFRDKGHILEWVKAYVNPYLHKPHYIDPLPPKVK